jgi:hypothetical protein
MAKAINPTTAPHPMPMQIPIGILPDTAPNIKPILIPKAVQRGIARIASDFLSFFVFLH